MWGASCSLRLHEKTPKLGAHSRFRSRSAAFLCQQTRIPSHGWNDKHGCQFAFVIGHCVVWTTHLSVCHFDLETRVGWRRDAAGFKAGCRIGTQIGCFFGTPQSVACTFCLSEVSLFSGLRWWPFTRHLSIGTICLFLLIKKITMQMWLLTRLSKMLYI